ncbi:MAG: hypothetical protein K5865_09290 [Eubacterium sp.]|jgi:Flp pilus assembly pilin Flp|nr:hypothetical protein [Eubacterium sp.]
MRELCERIKTNINSVNESNKGVAAIEVILILVVLIGLVVIFKSQAIALVTKIWNAITDNAGSITG